MKASAPSVAELHHISTRFGSHVIHEDISLRIDRGEIVALLGGSGSGKTTLMRVMALLHRPQSGTVKLFGNQVSYAGQDEFELRRRMGYMFQFGALFGGLTVRHNVAMPLLEHTALSARLVGEIAQLKIQLVGLAPHVAGLMPSELSGGMIKRAAMARTLALDPELLMLDEPGSGLDPASARSLDELILRLRDALGLTVIMVTHDLISVQGIADRAILLHDGKILADDAPKKLLQSEDPTVRYFFQLKIERSHLVEDKEVTL
ncbi:MAG: ATP-binding cassette domain-containing protein [Gammaproteobacteria bacterium]|nr:ATP-binding cassette domain-containing protein [Gammaproteobacteria bacterium]